MSGHARKHLNKTSNASDEEKRAELIASAIDAGWKDEEVHLATADAANGIGDVTSALGVVPSSSR
ncbi:hypothetical protein ASE04_29620 [Rhizobium sp. Root708]|nr:hypothetical protein ASE04_29620 [Rhizobium sp. Root708]